MLSQRKSPPQIFSPALKTMRVDRAHWRQSDRAMIENGDPTSFLTEHIAEDIVERLEFVRHRPDKLAYFGLGSRVLSDFVIIRNESGFHYPDAWAKEDQPFAISEFDTIISINRHDTVNDLPGALIHIRNALQPGGLAIVSFPAAGSLPILRSSLLAAEADRPAARMHPLVDAKGGADLLQRAGWKDPVVDTRQIRVAYRSLGKLVNDLRDEGLTNVLRSRAPFFSKAAWQRANDAFMAHADQEGRVTETFEIITLTGRRSLAGT